MSHLSFTSIFVIASALVTTGAVGQSHQASQAETGTYSADQCELAKTWLVKTQGRSPDQTESERQYAIWSSPACVAYRKPRELNVTPDMRKTVALLRENGIDIEARMPAKVADCRAKAPADLLAIPVSERATITVEEVAATCVLNARTELYAEALNELNANRQQKFAKDTAEYERLKQERVAKLAENERIKKDQADKLAAYQADYERQMEEWRTAVALCKKGRREYCAK